MIRRPPRSTRTDTLFPYTTLFRSPLHKGDTMTALLPNVNPEGLLEYSVVFTDRALNHMSEAFQEVMRDISATLRRAYRSEEHTSELQSLMRISYAVFCLKKKNIQNTQIISDDGNQSNKCIT